MRTKAVRLYGKDDLRLETFELPEPREDEILAKVVSDSICMSSYKAAHQADTHKRVPRDISEKPVIIGHEFAGEIISVGKNNYGLPATEVLERLKAFGYTVYRTDLDGNVEIRIDG
jgi:threonine dehydrogenase-like Zn-dependent dehydrogenase